MSKDGRYVAVAMESLPRFIGHGVSDVVGNKPDKYPRVLSNVNVHKIYHPQTD
jgi:hypothetical protein